MFGFLKRASGPHCNEQVSGPRFACCGLAHRVAERAEPPHLNQLQPPWPSVPEFGFEFVVHGARLINAPGRFGCGRVVAVSKSGRRYRCRSIPQSGLVVTRRTLSARGPSRRPITFLIIIASSYRQKCKGGLIPRAFLSLTMVKKRRQVCDNMVLTASSGYAR